jgi:hypothetical protein
MDSVHTAHRGGPVEEKETAEGQTQAEQKTLHLSFQISVQCWSPGGFMGTP